MVKAREQLIPNPETSQTIAEPPPAAASVVGLSKRFGKTSVLENISFDVAEGEVLVLPFAFAALFLRHLALAARVSFHGESPARPGSFDFLDQQPLPLPRADNRSAKDAIAPIRNERLHRTPDHLCHEHALSQLELFGCANPVEYIDFGIFSELSRSRTQ